MNMPDVTVVVPSYNSGHFLKWTLESIANQTLKNFECIVVDDCSTDGSIEQAKAYFNDPRFKLIRHKMNVGLSGARNTGLRAARGEFIAFLDSDDLMMRNSLEVRVDACRWGLASSDRFAGSYCGSMHLEEEEDTAPQSRPMELGFVTFLSSNGNCPFNANQPMLRRDILRLAGGFNHGLKQAEDFDFWLRILRAGYVFAPAKHVAVTYRKRAGSMIRRQPLAHLDLSLAIINSSEVPLKDDQLDWSQYRMAKPLGDYIAQKRKLNRVLEFVGMGLASEEPETVEKLADLISREIPDIRLIVNSEREIEALIHKGIRRQKSIVGDIPAADLETTREILAVLKDVPRPDGGEKGVPATVYADQSRDRPWFSTLQRQYQIVFIPHSAYHVWTISLIGERLRQLGIGFITIDISQEWRDGGVRAAAAKHDLEILSLSEFALGQYAPRAIVTFNDWDPVTRPLVLAAKASGIKTIAIVEGIQDYDDADVHWRRYAYKTSDVVLLPGEFDSKYFVGHEAVVEAVGVPRLETLRTKEKRKWLKRTPRVLINSNFSYGVLVEHRDAWLTDCVEATQELGMTPIISRHPGDQGKLFPELTSSQSFYDLIEECDVSIQRFASGVLEALARDVGVIYYNPHGEKVDKFQQDPMGAYVLSLTKEALKKELKNWWKLHEMAAENGGPFLDHHSGPLDDSGAIDRTACALKNYMGPAPSLETLEVFRKHVAVLDRETLAFSQTRIDNQPIFPDPALGIAKLKEMGANYDSAKASGNNSRTAAQHSHTDLTLSTNGHSVVETFLGPLRRAASEADSDIWLLMSLSQSLILNGKSTLKLFESERTLIEALERATCRLPSDNSVLIHFNKVKAYAQAKHTS